LEEEKFADFGGDKHDLLGMLTALILSLVGKLAEEPRIRGELILP